MSQILSVQLGTLLVLSGLPGAGKSHLKHNAQGLPANCWLSMDSLRSHLLGELPDVRDGRWLREVRQDSNEAVFNIFRTMARERLRHGLTVVLDATHPTDCDRQVWVDLAEELGAPYLVVIVDTPLEQCLANMTRREDWVPDFAIREMEQPPAPVIPEHVLQAAKAKGREVSVTPAQGFMRTSRFKHVVVSSDAQLVFAPPALASAKCDVIGDVHGLYDELLQLLEKAGWSLVEGHLRHADPERRLLFMGDLTDRGLKTLEVLELVKTAVADGVAQALQGNHEKKNLSFLAQAQTTGVDRWTSWANADTGMMLLKLAPERREALVRFMRQMPAFVTHEDSKTAFVHADMHRFDPQLSLKADMVNGQSGWNRVDSDALYDERYRAGLNRYVLIRGHFPNTSAQESVFSLEKHAFQKGELLLLRFDDYLADVEGGLPRSYAFAANVMTHKCDFDFEAYSAKRFELGKAMESLVERKLAIRFSDDGHMLRGYKYAREVFWNHSWNTDPWLMKARGLVLDPSGAIISHPFDKCFNYGEEGAGLELPNDTRILEVEKLNGFLGIVDRHPLKNDLLFHTQGGFGGKFVDYIRESMTPEQMGRTKGFLARNEVTLMFEVLHREDPHIIEYPTEALGLYLIGVRGKGFNDQPWTEEEVDAAAAQMAYRRPEWRRTTKGELLAKARRDGDGLVKHEGWMARLDTPQQEYLFKLKTAFYLVTKFVARLGAGKVKHLFQSPESFKRNLDEEFYPLVDALIARHTCEGILALDESQRVATVRQLVIDLID